MILGRKRCTGTEGRKTTHVHFHTPPCPAMGDPLEKEEKARLDGTLSNLVWWKASLPMAGGWNWSLPKPVYDFIILYEKPLFSSAKDVTMNM